MKLSRTQFNFTFRQVHLINKPFYSLTLSRINRDAVISRHLRSIQSPVACLRILTRLFAHTAPANVFSFEISRQLRNGPLIVRTHLTRQDTLLRRVCVWRFWNYRILRIAERSRIIKCGPLCSPLFSRRDVVESLEGVIQVFLVF
jgi:hypothetical protein